MVIGIIQNNICINAIECESLEMANRLFPDDTAAIVAEGFGIGDLYQNGTWSKQEPSEEELNEVEKLRADVDYILIMMEE